MLLRLQKYNLHVKYLPGSQMHIADMLNRAYLQADHSQHGNIPEYQIFQFSQKHYCCFKRLLTSIKLIICAYQKGLISKSNSHNRRCCIAKSHEHDSDKLATYQRGSSSLYPRGLELQRRVKSSRWSLVQRNKSDCSCFYETSDDCKSSLQPPWAWCLCTSSAQCAILAEHGRLNQQSSSELWSLQWLLS